jgi:lipid-binding SYLF domain-containing protein
MIVSAKRLVAVLGFALFGLFATAAEARTDGQQRVVERARLVLDSFLDDPNFEDMRVYVQNAYAVVIVPEVLKGGFVLGAEYGIGILLVRDVATGSWSQPAFYALYGGSFGLQMGGLSSDVVLTVMNEGAVEKLMKYRVQLGADVGIAVGRLGAGVGAAITTHFGEDVYGFAKSKGLFGGVALGGSYLAPKADWNQAYYGRPIEPAEIVRGDRQVIASAEIVALHQSLTQF